MVARLTIIQAQMSLGSSKKYNIPIVDGDFMGRAYPTGWQVTPNVYDTSGKGSTMLPSVIASGDGSSLASIAPEFRSFSMLTCYCVASLL
jgi:DUF917 family protein